MNTVNDQPGKWCTSWVVGDSRHLARVVHDSESQATLHKLRMARELGVDVTIYFEEHRAS